MVVSKQLTGARQANPDSLVKPRSPASWEEAPPINDPVDHTSPSPQKNIWGPIAQKTWLLTVAPGFRSLATGV